MNNFLIYLGIFVAIISILLGFYYFFFRDDTSISSKIILPLIGLLLGFSCTYIGKNFSFPPIPNEAINEAINKPLFKISTILLLIYLLYMIFSALYLNLVEKKRMRKFRNKYERHFDIDNIYKAKNVISKDTVVKFISNRTKVELKFTFSDISDRALTYIIRDNKMLLKTKKGNYIGVLDYDPDLFNMVQNKSFKKWIRKARRRRFFEYFGSFNPVILIELKPNK